MCRRNSCSSRLYAKIQSSSVNKNAVTLGGARRGKKTFHPLSLLNFLFSTWMITVFRQNENDGGRLTRARLRIRFLEKRRIFDLVDTRSSKVTAKLQIKWLTTLDGREAEKREKECVSRGLVATSVTFDPRLKSVGRPALSSRSTTSKQVTFSYNARLECDESYSNRPATVDLVLSSFRLSLFSLPLNDPHSHTRHHKEISAHINLIAAIAAADGPALLSADRCCKRVVIENSTNKGIV